MNFFAQLTQQLSQLFNSQTGARRIVFMFVTALSIGGLIYLAVFARAGAYKPLYSDLQPSDAAGAASKLRALDFPVRIADGGRTIEVASEKWDQALMILAQEGFPGSGVIGYEMMDKSGIGLSQLEQEVRFHRSLEGELARTIMTIRGIERARVHLTMPKPSVFVRDRVKPTASVIVRPRSGASLEQKEVEGIVHLIASAVEGLDPDDVSVVDSDGRMLNRDPQSEENAELGRLVAYKTNYENLLKKRIETMLEKTLGEGRVTAQVNADFDFSQKSTTSEKYNPDEAVVRSETLSSSGPGVGAGAGGAARSGSNQTGGEPAALPVGEAMGKIDRETSYEISRETQEVIQTMPMLNRLTVSVLVDGVYEEAENAEGETVREFAPRPQNELSDIEETVKSVIGFSDERPGGISDVVTVKSFPFRLQEFDMEGAPAPNPLLSPDMIMNVIRWSVVGLIGLLVVFVVLRPAVKSITLTPSPSGGPGALPGGGDRAGLLGMGGQSSSGYDDAGRIGADETGRGLPQGEARAQAQRRLNLSPDELHSEISDAARNKPNRAAGVLRSWIEEQS